MLAMRVVTQPTEAFLASFRCYTESANGQYFEPNKFSVLSVY